MALLNTPNVVFNPAVDPNVVRVERVQVLSLRPGDQVDVAPVMQNPRIAAYHAILTPATRGQCTIAGSVLTVPAGAGLIATGEPAYIFLIGS